MYMPYTQTAERGGRRREVEEEDGGDGGGEDGATADQRAAPPHPPPLPSASRFQVRKVLRKRGGGGDEGDRSSQNEKRGEERGGGRRERRKIRLFHAYFFSPKKACLPLLPERERERKEGHSPLIHATYTYLLHVRYPARGEASYSLSLLLSISPLPRFSTDVTAFFRKEGRGKKSDCEGEIMAGAKKRHFPSFSKF